MSIEAAVRTRLLAVSGVSSLVSARVYPAPLPQQAATGTWLPAISYSVLSERRQSTFGGPTALPGVLFGIDCWAADYDGARALAKQVRLALDDWSGTSQSETIQACWIEGQQDIYEAEVNVHRVAMEARVYWNEPQT